MNAARSALEFIYKEGRYGAEGPVQVTICERRDRTLLQISAWKETFAEVCGRLGEFLNLLVPITCFRAITREDLTIFPVSPDCLWVSCPEGEIDVQYLEKKISLGHAVVTDLGHSRTIIRLNGRGAQDLLSSSLPVDLDDSVFPLNAFAQSVTHHVSVLLHRIGSEENKIFDAYVSRDLAASYWEFLLSAAASLGFEVAPAMTKRSSTNSSKTRNF